MPFLGTTPTQGFVGANPKQSFTANGSTTVFTLTNPVASANDLEVFVGNVRQEPTAAYSAAGTTLTMTEAPDTGLNFYVINKSQAQVTTTLGANSVSTSQIIDSNITNAKLATGITASKLTGALPAIDGSSLTNVSKDMVLLSTQTEPTAAVTFTLTLDSTGTYSEQIFVLAGWYQVNLVDTYLRVVEGGSVISGSSTYQYNFLATNNSTSSVSSQGSNGQTYIRTNWYSTGDSANETNDLIIHVRFAESSTQRTIINGEHNGLAGNANYTNSIFVGRRASTAVATAIQLLSNNAGSNFVFANGGYIKHYGVK